MYVWSYAKKSTLYINSFWRITWLIILDHSAHAPVWLTTLIWNEWVKLLTLCLTKCEKSTSYLNSFVRYCTLNNPAFWWARSFPGKTQQREFFQMYGLQRKESRIFRTFFMEYFYKNEIPYFGTFFAQI